MDFEILTSTDVKMPNNPPINFPFECDSFQLHAFNSIEQGKHILVSAPTSSGKTLCAEYAIHYHLKHNKRIIYTSPIKSLSNEKYKDFKDKEICKVGLLTGDNKINPDADLVIATAEILRNSLYQIKQDKQDKQDKQEVEYNILDNVGCVIMDEVHFINDLDRGKVWEETLILLDDSIQLILLSATIDRVSEFAKWIQSIKKKQLSLIPTNRRIIPLTHSIFVDDELYTVLDNHDTFNEEIYHSTKRIYEKLKKDPKYNPTETQQINTLIKYLIKKDLLQTIFFSFSRIKCEDYAKSVAQYLIEPEEQAEALRIFDYNIAPYRKIYESLPQFITVRQLIQKGVAFHHSGLIPILKEIIEIIFKKGLIKILFATETFAVGVNMPTRTVVFTNLSKNTSRGRRFLNTAEYKQMSGRAGRRGMDTTGTVILMTLYDYPELNDLKSVMIKTMPHISSKFKIDYAYCLKTLNSTNTSPESLFNSSLLANEINISINNDKKKLIDLETKYNIAYNTFTTNYPNDIITNCSKIYSQENKNLLGGNLDILIKLTPKQRKDMDKLKKSVPEQVYTEYKLIKEYEDDYKICKNIIEEENNYIKTNTDKIYNILEKKGFLTNNNELTVKGIIASLVNDCNGILLAEIISNNMLNNLDTKEIISLVSIFTNVPVTDNDVVYKSKHLNDEYQNIVKIADSYYQLEKENRMYIDEEYWTITNKYIDLTYDWVNTDEKTNFEDLRKNMLLYLGEINEYEGNFVRNMLKIYNILNNIKSLCNILKYFELVQKLEMVDTLLLKDIVNVNSLYLK